MKKKITAVLLAVALVLSLGLVMAAPVAATTESIVLVSSDTETDTAGYTTTDPVADPLNASNYSGGGTWSGAVDLSSPNALWYDETLVTPAVWVSSADSPEGNTANDQWRLFKEEFTIPTGAVITSASLVMSADNSVEAYLNGTSVGTADDAVFGAAPGPPFSDPADYHFRFLWGPFDLEPEIQEGTNTLMFVVRNWASEGDNPTGLLYRAEIEYEVPDIEKTMASDGYLGDIITVTLDVENPYAYDLTVQDVIPSGLKYIPGTLYLDSTQLPDPVGNTISVSVPQGDFTITFDVQVVEVQYEDEIVTNWARLYDGIDLLDSDSEDITLHPYAGFSKEVLLSTNDPWDEVPVETDVHWLLLITVENIDTDEIGIMDYVIVKDRFGGDLEVHKTLADGRVFIQPPWSGDVDLKEKGKTKKIFLTWDNFGDLGDGTDLDDGSLAQLWIEISTDINPGQGKKIPPKNEYTDEEPTEHELNSGAVLKFFDSDGTGFQLSAHTPPLTVTTFIP